MSPHAFGASRRAPLGLAYLGHVALSFDGLKASARSAQAAPTTFSKDVAPILFAKCVTCHRPSGAAPFSPVGANLKAPVGSLTLKW